MIDLPQAADPDDVLSQRTRARLFVLLSELRRPVGTAELAERLQLHVNGVRLHLERLEDAGLIERARIRHGRGRPPDMWAIHPQARPGGEPPHAYQDLGRWLARALLQPTRGLTAIEATGRSIGRELAPEATGHGIDELTTTLAAHGFQPTVTHNSGDRVTICLRNCPYREAARENQPAICALHKGITRGLLDVLAPDARLTGFSARNPGEASCELEIDGVEPR
ncbi:MAG TPA: helix-turn-helix domain-containing protein [Solirubrobacteraceae bacterium]